MSNPSSSSHANGDGHGASSGVKRSACLASLPREILGIIVTMAMHQDVAYKTRTAMLPHSAQPDRRRPTLSADPPDLSGRDIVTDERYYRTWYGRSIYALSLTSKGLSVLAGAHIFETLHSRKLKPGKLEVFCSIVLPRHASDFRTVDLDGDRAAMALLLSWIPLLPKIDRLSIETDLVWRWASPEWRILFKPIAEALAPRITRVVFRDLATTTIQPQHASSFLKMFPSLDRLDLSLRGLWNSVDGPDSPWNGAVPFVETDASRTLVDTLLQHKHLRHLSIRHDYPSPLPESWTRLNPENFPYLTSFCLRTPRCPSSVVWDSVFPFASQLTHLEVAFTHHSAPPPPPTPPMGIPPIPPVEFTFGKLRSLVIFGPETPKNPPPAPPTWSMKHEVARCRFPCVVSLYLFRSDCCKIGHSLSFLRLFPELSRFLYVNKELPLDAAPPIWATDTYHLESFAGESKLVTYDKYDVFGRQPSFTQRRVTNEEREDEQDSRKSYLWESLDRVLSSASMRLQLLEAVDDAAGTRKLMPYLRGLAELELMELD